MQDKDTQNLLLDQLIHISGFLYQWSFHTITFNIIDNFNKNDLKKAIDTYIRWIKNILKTDFNGFMDLDNILYIYTFEISEELHLHVHLILNNEINEKFKSKLLKDWNNYNEWPWYNKRSLLIKNYTEYESIEETIALHFSKNSIYENALIILNYMLKDFINIEKLMQINYILYPLNIVNGSMQKIQQFDNIIKKLNNYYKKNIYDWYNFKKLHQLGIKNVYNELKNPFLEDINDKEKLFYIYQSWKLKFEYSEKALKILFTKLKQQENLEKKQEILEEYLKDKEETWNEIKLYSMKNSDLRLLNEIFLKNLENKLNFSIKEYELMLSLEDINNTIYYVLESLVKVIRFYKKEYNNKTEQIELNEDIQFSYTESYFKSILREMYIINIIHKNLPNYQLLYENKDEIFLNKINKKEYHESILIFLIEKQTPKMYYKNNLEKIEKVLAVWSDLILEILYEIDIIKKIDQISIYINDKNQNYFTLSSEFLDYLLYEEYTYEIIPPMLLKPKDYEYKNKEIIGGYYKISNILFSINENLKYQMSENILNIINKSQTISLTINKKYLNYLLNSDIKKIQQLTGLHFYNYMENYLEAKIVDIKRIPDIFLIHEFFLSIYIAEAFQNDELWYISRLDERGRKYDIGYPLNFYRDKILRNLFVWNKDKILEDLEMPLSKKQQLYLLYKNYFNEIIFKEEEYNIFNILESPFECLVGFDATNQIYQIIGGLIREKKLLQLSKVIKNESEEDIYSYFLYRLKKELLFNNNFKNLIERMQQMIMKEKSIIKMSTSLNSLDLKYFVEIFNRKWIKNILMTYGYNKSVIQLIYTTENFIFTNLFSLKTFSFLIKRKVKEVATFIINVLIKDFNQEIKLLFNLKILFNSLVIIGKLLKKSINITTNKQNYKQIYEGFSQYYLKIENVTFQTWRKVMLGKEIKVGQKDKNYYWKKVRVTYPKIQENSKEPKNLDFKKNLNALLPNTCHYLDSLLMYKVLEKIMELKIPIKTIHDSFYTNIKYKNDISNIYVSQYIELFKKNILEKIIQNALDDFLLDKDFFNLISDLNRCFNQQIPFTPLKNWIFYDKKMLKTLNLNDIQKKLYTCLLQINKNYKIINENELMNINFEEYLEKNKNENIIV